LLPSRNGCSGRRVLLARHGESWGAVTIAEILARLSLFGTAVLFPTGGHGSSIEVAGGCVIAVGP
jgi:hypothetical protein